VKLSNALHFRGFKSEVTAENRKIKLAISMQYDLFGKYFRNAAPGGTTLI
jgi:hypothetical protein